MHRAGDSDDEAEPTRFGTAHRSTQVRPPISARNGIRHTRNSMQTHHPQQQQANKPANVYSQWRLFRFSSSISLPQVAHAASSPLNYATNKFWRLTSQITARYTSDTSRRSTLNRNNTDIASAVNRGLNIASTAIPSATNGILRRDLSLPSFHCADHDHATLRLLRHEERCRRRRRKNNRINAQTRTTTESALTTDSSADETCADLSSQDEGLSKNASKAVKSPIIDATEGGLWPMTMPCRVCMQDSVINSPVMARQQLDLVRPCRCTGTVAWVHNACLASWVFMDNVGGPGPAAHPRCELCSTHYTFRLRRRPFRQWALSLVSHSAVFWAVSLAVLPLPTLNFLCNVHALRFGKFLSICDSTDFNELKWCATSLAGMVMFWCANDYCRFLETWRGGATSASATKAGLFVYMSICVLCLSSNDLRRTWRKWRSAQFEVDFEDFSPPSTTSSPTIPSDVRGKTH